MTLLERSQLAKYIEDECLRLSIPWNPINVITLMDDNGLLKRQCSRLLYIGTDEEKLAEACHGILFK